MLRTHCPVCHSKKVEEIYNFGSVPFTTQYLPTPSTSFETYPLTINGCHDCNFVFIPKPIDPETLYSDNYNLTSSYPAMHLDHLSEMLAEPIKSNDAFIFEIAANDGYFLEHFSKKGFKNLLGIEPSANCVKNASEKGVNVINDFFSHTSSRSIRKTHGKADLVIIRHAIEHIMDLDDLLKGISEICAEEGSVYVEFPDSDLAFQHSKFMYFFEQHVNYFTTATCQKVFNRFGFQLAEEFIFSYGGGSKGLLFKRSPSAQVEEKASNASNEIDIITLRNRISKAINKIIGFIRENPDATFGLYGIGFVGISLINNSEMAGNLSCLFDDSPTKKGLFLPGCNLEILTGEHLLDKKPDYCFIAPLNEKEFERNIIHKNQSYIDNGGSFIEFFPKDNETDLFHVIGKAN